MSSEETGDLDGIPRVGDRIDDKYVVEGVLGSGGMGVVLTARHRHLDERVAIKVLRPHIAKDDVLVRRFLREARASLAVQSAHVVRVMDMGLLASGSPFIVMEHLDGKDLHDVLVERGPLPIAEAASYVLQACDALAEAHHLGIIHRDLKPGNLFVTHKADGSPLVKVLDFGISTAAIESVRDVEVSLTETAAILGSPGYMSPEQVRNAKNVDARADIWSLGVILYKLLVGEAPFEGETFASVCAAIVADAPIAPRSRRPEIPIALEAIVLRCLEKRPAARFADVREVAAALAPFAATLRAPLPAPLSAPSPASSRSIDAALGAPAAEPAGPTVSSLPRARRRRAAWAFGAIAVVGLIALLAGRRASREAERARADAAASTASQPAAATTAVATTSAPAPSASTVAAAPRSLGPVPSAIASVPTAPKPGVAPPRPSVTIAPARSTAPSSSGPPEPVVDPLAYAN